MQNILEVKNLTKNFISGIFNPKKFIAVDNVSFELNQGEILALLGSNGAGKTTLMQMLLSTLTPTSGSIKYFGKSLKKHRSDILKQVGFASSYTKLPPNLLVKENMVILGNLYGLTEKQALQNSFELLEQLNMSHLFNKKNGVLSAGQSAIVQLVKALMIKPKIIILDEPMAALDVDIAQEARDLIKDYNKKNGLAVIITSHNMEEVEQLVDRVLIMKEGKLIANATPYELIKKVKTAHIELCTAQTEKFENFLQEKNMPWQFIEGEYNFKIDEKMITDFLQALQKDKIKFTEISIKRPTLEDYFKVVNKNRTKNEF
jgi:ABC-2 type transport system ATP-binding protein